MALIVLSGYPCSGKTTRAAELRDFIEARIKEGQKRGKSYSFSSVRIINDESIGLQKVSYSTTMREKAARGALYSAIQRAMVPGQAVIIDALNYIKGFRYQIYCMGRELGFRQVTIHIAVPEDLCKSWNQARWESDRYTDSSMDELIMRYEEPDAFNRWESPLVVLPRDDGPGIQGRTGEEIWTAITEGQLRPPNAATVSSTVAQTDQLQLIESTTSSLVNQVASSLRDDPSRPVVKLCLGDTHTLELVMPGVALRHTPSMVALQGIKRQFIQMHRTAHVSGASLGIDRTVSKKSGGSTSSFRKTTASAPASTPTVRSKGFVEAFREESVAENFVHYLESCLATG